MKTFQVSLRPKVRLALYSTGKGVILANSSLIELFKDEDISSLTGLLCCETDWKYSTCANTAKRIYDIIKEE